MKLSRCQRVILVGIVNMKFSSDFQKIGVPHGSHLFPPLATFRRQTMPRPIRVLVPPLESSHSRGAQSHLSKRFYEQLTSYGPRKGPSQARKRVHRVANRLATMKTTGTANFLKSAPARPKHFFSEKNLSPKRRQAKIGLGLFSFPPANFQAESSIAQQAKSSTHLSNCQAKSSTHLSNGPANF